MKVADLKIGDKVDTWCTGMEVKGEIIEINDNHIVVEHEPVRWGNDIHTKTSVCKSTYLQTKYGSPTSPKCTFNGEQILF